MGWLSYILTGWAACGLFLFNPNRVYRKTSKSLTQSNVPSVDEIEVGSNYLDEVLQTPVKSVLAEGLASLYNLIKQDVYILNKTKYIAYKETCTEACRCCSNILC
jgi:hypothetical protein